MSYYFEIYRQNLKNVIARPMTSLILVGFSIIAYMAIQINILRLLVERNIIFAFRDQGLLSMEPYYWSKPIAFFFFLAVIIFYVIQRDMEKMPRFPYKFSVPAFLINISATVVFLSYTHFITKRAAIFEAHSFVMAGLWYLLGFIVLIAILFIFVDFRVFGNLIKTFKKEWILSSSFAVLFLATFPLVQRLWQPFAFFAGKMVAKALAFSHPGSWFNPTTNTLYVREFSTSIGEPCSGVEGMSLFIILFTAMLIVDWKRIYKGKALLLYPIGVIMMSVANIVRIYAIELLGYQISLKFGPDVAHKIVMDQFHSHFGWIFYTILILIFFKIAYPFFIRPAKTVKDSAFG
jgi:exosortase/archaeosortase family protein